MQEVPCLQSWAYRSWLFAQGQVSGFALLMSLTCFTAQPQLPIIWYLELALALHTLLVDCSQSSQAIVMLH